MLAPRETPREGVRSVTDDEVQHFRTKGWVVLRAFYAPWVVEGVLERARARMGEAPLTVSRTDPHARMPNEFNWYARWDGCSHHDAWIHQFSHSQALARGAARLMGSARVRFYFDHVFVKLPSSSGGGKTPWHQDLPHHPLDRQGALTMWAPLVECPPEMGSMRFLGGSHRVGLLGRYLNRRDGVSLVDENPWVLDAHESSPPLHLRPGDITVHDLAVVHCAQENRSTAPRWVYATQWLPPAARYTGAPNHRTDGHGLALDEPLDHPRFPLIPFESTD
ncbi:phytanoyl-CoA dioxygenase family protein [Myxococcus sp. K15C18031901]|uniref:phytanoyl-CoA dioxygenase family protein n=1 Tax=Myxococcus dinghuensis TaxID=2906761 RepID=UPI0020A703E4|nr:phytanoyl-CoA dioxygenase family protein [Myxococcus dinghuensis]MCP3102432.1 phytanoyl-CoA dioxygenase family protein [Myxococcus dinghuensis]